MPGMSLGSGNTGGAQGQQKCKKKGGLGGMLGGVLTGDSGC